MTARIENIPCHKGLVEAPPSVCQKKQRRRSWAELRAAFEHSQRGREYLTLQKPLTQWQKQELMYVFGLPTEAWHFKGGLWF